MNMNRAQYDQLRKHVTSLEYKLKDAIDDHTHADARHFKDDLRRIEDTLQAYANPRSIEALVKNAQNKFKNYDNAAVMSQQDLNYFEDCMNDIVQDLRKFDNY